MPTPPLIVRDGGTLTLTFDDVAPVVVDLACFAYAVEPSSEVETIDIGTFCAPNATDQGKVTESIVISMLWSADLYAALQPHIGEIAALAYDPDGTGSGIMADVKYTVMPWGRFEIGQRVEVDLPLAVLSPITYGTVVLGAGTAAPASSGPDAIAA